MGLVAKHPKEASAVLISLGGIVGGIVGSGLTLLASAYAARLGFRAEVMKLRHPIAQRRIHEFDGAAGDLRAMMLEIGCLGFDNPAGQKAIDRFKETFPGATLKVVMASELAMLPKHTELLKPLGLDLLQSSRALFEHLMKAPGVQEEHRRVAKELANRITLLVHLYMKAVDVSIEAKLVGGSSRKQDALIKGFAKDWDSQKDVGTVPRSDGET
jgi:hypothetical protein